MQRVLLLGGTSEAFALAEAAGRHDTLQVISSLAGRTRTPRLPPGEVRIGGFGGSKALARYLVAQKIARVVDATHPFAARISANAYSACRAADVPRLRLLRAAWPKQPGDRWIEVADLEAAARTLPMTGGRALLTIGSSETQAFAAVEGVRLLVRSIERPVRMPTPNAVWLPGRGPFDLEAELALFGQHAIDVLVTKASGGASTYAKIEAARRLHVPVIMVRRPPPPAGPLVHTVAEALNWIMAGSSHGESGAGRSTWW